MDSKSATVMLCLAAVTAGAAAVSVRQAMVMRRLERRWTSMAHLVITRPSYDVPDCPAEPFVPRLVK
jgi:hypothetical protein